MSYPTTILYNNSHSNIFHGVRDAAGITEFIQDMLQPQGEFLTILWLKRLYSFFVFDYKPTKYHIRNAKNEYWKTRNF